MGESLLTSELSQRGTSISPTRHESDSCFRDAASFTFTERELHDASSSYREKRKFSESKNANTLLKVVVENSYSMGFCVLQKVSW